MAKSKFSMYFVRRKKERKNNENLVYEGGTPFSEFFRFFLRLTKFSTHFWMKKNDAKKFEKSKIFRGDPCRK